MSESKTVKYLVTVEHAQPGSRRPWNKLVEAANETEAAEAVLRDYRLSMRHGEVTLLGVVVPGPEDLAEMPICDTFWYWPPGYQNRRESTSLIRRAVRTQPATRIPGHSTYEVEITHRSYDEEGHAPWSYVIEAANLDGAVAAVRSHFFREQLDSDPEKEEGIVLGAVAAGVPGPDCGYTWNDLRGT